MIVIPDVIIRLSEGYPEYPSRCLSQCPSRNTSGTSAPSPSHTPPTLTHVSPQTSLQPWRGRGSWRPCEAAAVSTRGCRQALSPPGRPCLLAREPLDLWHYFMVAFPNRSLFCLSLGSGRVATGGETNERISGSSLF